MKKNPISTITVSNVRGPRKARLMDFVATLADGTVVALKDVEVTPGYDAGALVHRTDITVGGEVPDGNQIFNRLMVDAGVVISAHQGFCGLSTPFVRMGLAQKPVATSR